jgi:hypothetical protein
VLGSGEGAMEKRSILGINEEIKVKMVGDNWCRGGGRHGRGKLSGSYSECRSLYSFSNSAA